MGIPTVVTGIVSELTSRSSVVAGNVISDGGTAVTTRGICYWTTPTPTVAENVESGGGGTGAYAVPLPGIDPETTYYARAFAENSDGIGYGADVVFTTPEDLETYRAFVDYPPGGVLYAKAKPLAANWATGIIWLLRNVGTPEYSANTFVRGTSYGVYQRIGASPASTDTKIETIHSPPPTLAAIVAALNADATQAQARADAATAAAEVVKVHRAASAVTPGAAQAKKLVDETGATLQQVHEVLMGDA